MKKKLQKSMDMEDQVITYGGEVVALILPSCNIRAEPCSEQLGTFKLQDLKGNLYNCFIYSRNDTLTQMS